MKTHNEALKNLSKQLSQDNIKKSMDTAKRLTRPSKATRIGSIIGGSIGVALLCAGTMGVIIGSNVLGVGSLIAGSAAIITNAKCARK